MYPDVEVFLTLEHCAVVWAPLFRAVHNGTNTPLPLTNFTGCNHPWSSMLSVVIHVRNMDDQSASLRDDLVPYSQPTVYTHGVGDQRGLS